MVTITTIAQETFFKPAIKKSAFSGGDNAVLLPPARKVAVDEDSFRGCLSAQAVISGQERGLNQWGGNLGPFTELCLIEAGDRMVDRDKGVVLKAVQMMESDTLPDYQLPQSPMAEIAAIASSATGLASSG